MNNNREHSSNSIKFAPMPVSALLANLMPLQRELEYPDSSFTTDDSDDSSGEQTNKKTCVLKKVHPTSTPKHTKTPDIKQFVSEKKVPSDYNKENVDKNKVTNQTFPSNNINPFQVSKPPNAVYCPKSDHKKNILVSQNINTKDQSLSSANLKTPEIKVPNSGQKTKVATPKIKSGIRRFTPGSARLSHKKLQPAVIQNRDRVRCELFGRNQPIKVEPRHSHTPVRSTESGSLRANESILAKPFESIPVKAPEPVPVRPLEPVPARPLEPVPARPEPVPVRPSETIPVRVPESTPVRPPEPIPLRALDPASMPAPESVAIPVPETPLNKKLMPAPYAATPSYPQGSANNNSKILFKTTVIKDKKYIYIKKLGTGGSSEVFKVLEIGSSHEYAVKCVHLATDQELAQGYINEVRLLRELQNSDRVIKLYDYEYDRANQYLRLVLEVGETDLSSVLRARGADLPPALLLHYWEEMLRAVLYIHEHGVIHSDLKPANFLLVCGRLKLIDFGIASSISSDATSVERSQAAGTYSYISPEALTAGAGGYGHSANIKISFRSDVWSLGCILYSMVYGRTPFGHIPNLAKLAAILDPNHQIDYPPVDHLPQSLVMSMRWCLRYVARSRPSVRELLAVRHLQAPPAHAHAPAPAPEPLPPALLDKLRPHLTEDEFTLLQSVRT